MYTIEIWFYNFIIWNAFANKYTKVFLYRESSHRDVFGVYLYRFDSTRGLTLVRHLRKASRTCRSPFLSWVRTLNGLCFWIERISQRIGQRDRQRSPETSFVEGSRSRCDTDSESRNLIQNLAASTKCAPAIFHKRCKRWRGRSMWTGEMAIHWFTFGFLHLSAGGLILDPSSLEACRARTSPTCLSKSPSRYANDWLIFQSDGQTAIRRCRKDLMHSQCVMHSEL